MPVAPTRGIKVVYEEQYGICVDKQKFNFCAAHFLIFKDGTREELHGHNYHVTVDVEGELSGGDLVVDFIPFKPMVTALCDGLDHCMLIPGENEKIQYEQREDTVYLSFDADRFMFPARDVRILPIPNTSTECLARYLAHAMREKIWADFSDARLTRLKVSVSESPGQAGWYACSLHPEA